MVSLELQPSLGLLRSQIALPQGGSFSAGQQPGQWLRVFINHMTPGDANGVPSGPTPTLSSKVLG